MRSHHDRLLLVQANADVDLEAVILYSFFSFFSFSGGMLLLAQIVPLKMLIFSTGMLDVLRKHVASLVCNQGLCTLRIIRMA